MYYDVLANTPLEIDGIQGFLYRQARKYKLTTPHLDTIYALLLSRHHVFQIIHSKHVHPIILYMLLMLILYLQFGGCVFILSLRSIDKTIR